MLVESFACRPGAASEPGLGWQYPCQFAQAGHEVTLVTRPEMGADVDKALRDMAVARLRVVYVKERAWPLRLGWTVGSALQYVLWLWEASEVARALNREDPFDLVHHASYGTLLGGTFLWRVPCPLVFGPVGGGQTAPNAFLDYFGPWRRAEYLRNLVVRHLWRLVWPAVRAARGAEVVLATNEETAVLARRMGARRVETVRDVGIDSDFAPAVPPHRDARNQMRILWLGRFLERKGLRLAVEAFEQLPDGTAAILEVLGAGYNDENQQLTERYLEAKMRTLPLEFHGRVPYEQIGKVYERADVFLFTGIRDSGGGQVLEAMAYGLPVVCLDHQGAAELVGDDGGLRVPVTTPMETRSALAGALARLVADPELRRALGAGAFRRAREFTWERKAAQVLAAAGVGGGSGLPPGGLGTGAE